MRKTRIAFFAEILIEDFDGASRTMYQLLHRIPRAAFDFKFFCGVPPQQDLGYDVVQLPTFRIPFNSTYRAVFPHFSKGKIKAQLDAFQPDVIHIATPSPLGNVALEYAKKNNIPVISIYHTHFISYIKYYFRKVPFLTPIFYKKSINLTSNFYKDVDLVYVPSKQIIAELKSICGLDSHNLQLWQRGMDTQLFNPNKKNPAYIQRIVQNQYPTILFASRLVWEKNLQVLIDLYQLCQTKGLPYHFVVAGDGVARAAVEEQMPNAHFLGALPHEELSVLYASADVFVFPSDTESFGNVVIEAMASGLPAVVADGGGPKGFVQHGINGFLCPVNDVETYLIYIQQILHNDSIRQNLIQNGLTFAQSLSWENLAKIYFEDLQKLAQQKIVEPALA